MIAPSARRNAFWRKRTFRAILGVLIPKSKSCWPQSSPAILLSLAMTTAMPRHQFRKVSERDTCDIRRISAPHI